MKDQVYIYRRVTQEYNSLSIRSTDPREGFAIRVSTSEVEVLN